MKYIRADLFMHRIANETLLSPSELTLIKCVMEQEPGEDVKPVVHAHWIPYESVTGEGSNTYKCSACDTIQTIIEGTPKENGWNYCPNCGADMRGGQDDESRSKSNAQTDTRARGMGTTDKSSGI